MDKKPESDPRVVLLMRTTPTPPVGFEEQMRREVAKALLVAKARPPFRP